MITKTFKAVLFDMDGSITDPKEGIINSVLYAAKKSGIEEKNPETLDSFIGPPLHVSFQKRYGLTEEEAFEMVRLYRVYYADKGMLQCYLYDGIEELIKQLFDEGVFLSLATSKPIGYANEILEHFGLDSYFSFTAGALMDGKRTDKKEVIQYALENIPAFEKEDILMIGDREFDVEGGQFHHLQTAWAAWGYGKPEILKPLKPHYIFETPAEVLKL